jgi:hypothetical protein
MKAWACPTRLAAKSIRDPERSEPPESSGGLFSLTPALSLREREQRSQSVENLWRASLAEALAMILPLPEGEGWGEGEYYTRPAPASDVSKLPCRYRRT